MSKHLFNNIERRSINIVKGEGIYLIDDKENKFMDLWGDYIHPLGYGGYINESLTEFIHKSLPHQNPKIIQVDIVDKAADMLCEMAGYDKVLFTSSGVLGIEAAVKLARKYWYDKGLYNKKTILSLYGGFHGRTYVGLSLSDADGYGSPYHRSGFSAYGCDNWESGYKIIPKAVLEKRQLKSFLKNHYLDCDTIAAILVTTINGVNTVFSYGKKNLLYLQSFCKQKNILFITDEIQTGMGCCGDILSYKIFGLNRPDISVVAKKLAMGFPLAAVLTTEEISETFTYGTHFDTFAGGTLACFMMFKYLLWYKNNFKDTLKMAEYLGKELQKLPFISKVTRFGWQMAFWLDDKIKNKKQFASFAINNGLIIGQFRENPIKLQPPFIITKEEIDMMIEKIKRTIKDMEVQE